VAIPEITVDELAERLAAGAALIDVRRPEEYAAGHVPGATLLTLDTVPDRLADVPASVLVICRTGGRSLAACEYLAAKGVEAANVAGGTVAWLDSGREVVEGDQPT
jgi:rhodanese-related sulfurtransferase